MAQRAASRRTGRCGLRLR
ncbi:MAG: hypothetical protein C4340_07325, partial [Armatimonadota bacterium]